jgi:hypothetical protein
MKEVKKFFECDCGSEVLAVERDDGYFNFCIFRQIPHPGNFWQRIRWAVNLLFKGEYYLDDICLNKEKTQELVKFLTEDLKNS